jgi:diadenosine tetraphosphate (Ap4A) HIT family hydrolase
MVDDALANRCPFCNIDREHNKVIAENDHWYAWPSNPPEKNTRLHFLYVPKVHITFFWELADEEVLSLFGNDGLRDKIHRKFGVSSCGLLMRDGDATLLAGTIQHLHIHDMVPDGTGRVESPFYKGAASEAESLERAIVFEKLRTGTPENELTEEERALVFGRL